MELSLKQSPSMDTNQDPMQAQLALQQRQLEQQQALEKADLSKVQGQIENKVGNKLDQHSPEDQKILKKALAKEAVRVGGEDARIGGIGVYPETGKLVALVGEFHHAYLDPKATLEAAKLATPEASKTLDPERERSPALDKTPERDTSQVLAKIDAKVEHKLDAYSPEEQQVLKQALAAEMVKIGGENAPISRMGVTDDGKIAVSNERHTAVIDARATLETAEKEQANLVREQAAQELAQQNPEQAALEKHVDERYDHYMATIQDEMKSLNAIRADYDNFAALPEAERDALNDRMNELSSQRSALHDVTDLPIQEQAAYYAQKDQGEAAPNIHQEQHSVPETQPVPPETVLPQEQSNTPPVPEGMISEDNLQRYADQGIEPVLESPPLNVPPLAPEDMTVSGAELNTISTEGAVVNAANTEAQAASETKEFTEINQTIDQMNDSSQKSTWETAREVASKVTDTTLDVAYEQYANARSGLETVASGATGFYSKIAGGIAGASYAIQGDFDRANEVLKETQKMYTYEPSEFTKAHLAPLTEPVNDFIDEMRQSAIDYYGRERAEHLFTALELATDLLGVAGMKHGLTGIRNAEYTAKFNQLPHNPNIAEHLKNVDGFDKTSGIKGGHNKDSLLQGLADNNLKLVNETQPVKGISEIRYGRDKIDGRGNPDGFKEYKIPKTVYDPKIHSDKQIFQMGKEAAVKGYPDAMKKFLTDPINNRLYTNKSSGVEFTIYLDDAGKISNFHPYIKK